MSVGRIAATTLIMIAIASVGLAAAPGAVAGGECNPGTVDTNCTYKDNSTQKTYFCSYWVGFCLADFSPAHYV